MHIFWNIYVCRIYSFHNYMLQSRQYDHAVNGCPEAAEHDDRLINKKAHRPAINAD